MGQKTLGVHYKNSHFLFLLLFTVGLLLPFLSVGGAVGLFLLFLLGLSVGGLLLDLDDLSLGLLLDLDDLSLGLLLDLLDGGSSLSLVIGHFVGVFVDFWEINSRKIRRCWSA